MAGPSTDSPSLEQLCSDKMLAFRAACNEVIDASFCPIKRRVIERISRSAEAKRLLPIIWSKSGMQPEKFFEILTKEPSWRTIVHEEVHRERSWSDLLKPKEGVWNWIKSFFEKLFDKHHPAARAATTILAIVVILRVTPIIRDLTLKITPTADDKPIRVTFSPTANETNIPIVLRVNPESNPIRLQLIGALNDVPNEKLDEIASQLRVSNGSLQNTAIALNLLASQSKKIDICKVDETLSKISTNLGGTREQIGEASKIISILNETYKASMNGLVSSSEAQNQNLNQELRVLARATSNPLNTISVALRPNSPQSIVLPFFDAASGQLSSTSLKIEVNRILLNKRTIELKLTTSSKNIDLGNVPKSIEAGSVVPLKSLNWTLTVNSIQKRWLRAPTVQLILSPDIPPMQNSKFAELNSGHDSGSDTLGVKQ